MVEVSVGDHDAVDLRDHAFLGLHLCPPPRHVALRVGLQLVEPVGIVDHHRIGRAVAEGQEFGEDLFDAVDVGLALAVAGAGQRENLVTPAVCQYGFIPAIEPVQAPGCFQCFKAGPQVQMIGIAQNNLCFYFTLQLFNRKRLYTAHCTHGHKDGCLNCSVISCDLSCSCF